MMALMENSGPYWGSSNNEIEGSLYEDCWRVQSLYRGGKKQGLTGLPTQVLKISDDEHADDDSSFKKISSGDCSRWASCGGDRTPWISKDWQSGRNLWSTKTSLHYHLDTLIFSAGLDFLVISTVNDMPDEHFFLSLGCFISWLHLGSSYYSIKCLCSSLIYYLLRSNLFNYSYVYQY